MGVDHTSLEKARSDWEFGLKVLVVLDLSAWTGTVLVVLERDGQTDLDLRYHCHRYFMVGLNWVCSVDGENLPLAAVWSWLNEPCPSATRPGYYASPLERDQYPQSKLAQPSDNL
jgi:hypothetical protein